MMLDDDDDDDDDDENGLKAFFLDQVGFFSRSCSPVMPLSTERKGMLTMLTTKIKFEQENPKSLGNKAYQWYEKYKGSTTIQDATQHGANWQDITVDFEKVPTTLSNRTTLSNSTNNAGIETHKVEMSAATMAAFRMIMREENGVIEEAITNKVHNSIQDFEELKQEREARMKLEECITK